MESSSARSWRGSACPIPTRRSRRAADGLNAMPDTDAPSPQRFRPARQPQPRPNASTCPSPVPQPPAPRARAGESWLVARAARAVRLEAELDRAPTCRRARSGALGETGFSPQERAMLTQHPGAARAPDRRRDGAARRHHRGAAGHLARRTDQGVRERRPFAPRRLQRDARRSGRHGAHPRRHRLHGAPRRGQRRRSNAKRKKPFPAGLDLKAIDLSMSLSATKIIRADPVRAALDAGDRPARQDAGDAHPSGAGDRRIRRHRRHRVDRGHRRADRRRHRGRARRGRGARRSCASRTARSSPMRARQLEDVVAAVGTGIRCRRGGRRGRYARRLHHDAGRPAFPCAARSCRARATSRSRCSTPIRAG